MLANQRLLTPFTKEEEAWIREKWLVVSCAHQREMIAAILMPDEVVAHLSMGNLMHTAQEGTFLYRVFDNVQEAAAWLRTRG